MKKTITIGASVAFYSTVAKLRRQLIKEGFAVHVPDVALEMEQKDNFDEIAQRERYATLTDEEKKHLVIHLFEKIKESDALLVVNEQKHGIDGYIGPNVLMEMTVALYLKKPIFLLNNLSEDLASFGEIMAIQPIVLNGNIRRITEYFKQKEYV
ncbi:hypothetical protein C5B42_00480 [Candidatus Cerribacteria bacterium 'Amazon FNV 2010 28 9']|uniref:Nucleoside 2-deoxyribosyltransferase n=1 Tax=Candidatus Cerribacteria bacterium 'Amazon FNV 2010 28 9' TaxID=2081795 RepID=A0A317JQF3_9BACT|nr:MAG: hypothetical protein C5B42_00480 [Candidatus Cerribacteria bacterium 'Amazon FNV 2010 28 9']